MLHYDLFKKKVKRNLLHQFFGYLLILVFLLIVCLIVKQKGIFVFLITYLIIIIYPLFKIIKSYLKLNSPISQDTKELMNDELRNPLFEGTDYTLTENYFIDNDNLNLIKYGDILLSETTKKLSLGSLFTSPIEILYLYTKNGNYSFITKDFFLLNNNDVYYEHLSDFIKKQNPYVLVGNYEENRKIIKEKFGVNIKKNWKKYFKIILDVR